MKTGFGRQKTGGTEENYENPLWQKRVSPK